MSKVFDIKSLLKAPVKTRILAIANAQANISTGKASALTEDDIQSIINSFTERQYSTYKEWKIYERSLRDMFIYLNQLRYLIRSIYMQIWNSILLMNIYNEYSDVITQALNLLEDKTKRLKILSYIRDHIILYGASYNPNIHNKLVLDLNVNSKTNAVNSNEREPPLAQKVLDLKEEATLHISNCKAVIDLVNESMEAHNYKITAFMDLITDIIKELSEPYIVITTDPDIKNNIYIKDYLTYIPDYSKIERNEDTYKEMKKRLIWLKIK